MVPIPTTLLGIPTALLMTITTGAVSTETLPIANRFGLAGEQTCEADDDDKKSEKFQHFDSELNFGEPTTTRVKMYLNDLKETVASFVERSSVLRAEGKTKNRSNCQIRPAKLICFKG